MSPSSKISLTPSSEISSPRAVGPLSGREWDHATSRARGAGGADRVVRGWVRQRIQHLWPRWSGSLLDQLLWLGTELGHVLRKGRRSVQCERLRGDQLKQRGRCSGHL